MPIAEARQILGKDFIIGGTANTFEDVQMHYQAGADYIGCGPFRFTTTKKNLKRKNNSDHHGRHIHTSPSVRHAVSIAIFTQRREANGKDATSKHSAKSWK